MLQPQITLNIQFVASFLALSIVGLANSIYLYWKHRQKKPLLCPLNHDCSKVTESKWSHMFYVRNEVVGILFYTAMITSLISVVFFSDFVSSFVSLLYILYFILFSTAFASVFSLLLIYIQLTKIHDYCFYCIVNAIITVLIFLNSIILVYL